jgi:hypothetical protein
MKKILRGVCLMGVVALLATSCNKNKDQGTATIKTFNQQFEVLDSDFGPGYDGEKVYLDQSNNKLYFEEGDKLTLFKINPAGYSASATFTPALTQVDHTTWTPDDPGTELPDEGDLYAFCPGGVNYVTAQLANGNRATFHIPAVQVYRENTLPVEGFFMASKLEEGQDAFYFRNICGALRLKLWSPNNRVVTSIVVKDKAKNICGDVTLIIPEVDPATLTSLYNNYSDDPAWQSANLYPYIRRSGYSVANGLNTITLDCGNGVQIANTKGAATDFYITLRPLALRSGCEITINYIGGSYTINSSKNNIIGPNIIRKMNPININ